MRKIKLTLIIILFSLIADSQENIEWITPFGGSSPYYGVELGRKIINDVEGNIYVSGEFADKIRLENMELYSNGDKEVFLAKLDSNGIARWILNFGSTEADWSGDICTDKNQNVYLTGTFRGQITIGDSIYTSEKWYDIFIIKLDKNGEIIWSNAFTGKGGNSTTAITIDQDGFIYITGKYGEILNFGSHQLHGPIGRSDLFVIKISSDGDIIWAKSTNSNANNYGNSITSDNKGHLYLTGFMWDTVYFDNHVLDSDGPMQAFLSKIDASNGDFIWAIGGGGNGWSEGNTVSVDNNGDIIMSGWYRNSLFFNNNSIYNGGNDNGPDDVFITKFDDKGNLKWIKSSVCNLYSNLYGLSIDKKDNIYLTGYYRGVLQFESYDFYSTVSSYYDIYVAKFNNSGDFIWLKSFGSGSPMNDKGYDILVYNNNLFVTGMYSDNCSFDDNVLSCNGASDIFVLKLSNTNDTTIINSIKNDIINSESIIYPNPFNNKLYFNNSENKIGNYQIKIYDLNGKLVFTSKYNFQELIEINTNELNRGIYFIQIIDLESKNTINKKIIKIDNY